VTARFRIEFEGFPDPDGAYLRAQGVLPFRLIAMADSDSPSVRYAFGVNYQLVSLEYEFLRKEPKGNSLEHAAIRWAISQVEESIRIGRMPPAGTKETQKFALREAELELLKRMASAKKCEYQRSSGRAERMDMARGRVTIVTFEAVSRVKPRELSHERIACDLGHDRCRDRRAKSITADNRFRPEAISGLSQPKESQCAVARARPEGPPLRAAALGAAALGGSIRWSGKTARSRR
jgi:hypothetical protein